MNDELFFAWLDGELDGVEAERVAALVAGDPALQARADAHRGLGAGLRGAFQAVADDAPPAPRFAAEVHALGRPASNDNHRRFGAVHWTAMAAALALGLVAAPFVRPQSGGPIDSKMAATGSLKQALDTQLASVPTSDGVRIGLTFKDKGGSVCRSFSGQASGSGLACRKGNDWKVEGLFATSAGQASDYRMAAGQDPRLAAMIDQRIAGEPMDAASEARAKEAGWR